jgi:hypothetical protein
MVQPVNPIKRGDDLALRRMQRMPGNITICARGRTSGAGARERRT